MRLPSASKLLLTIRTHKVDQSVAFLLARRGELKRYNDIEDLFFPVDATQDSPLRGFDHHFGLVRGALAKRLWSLRLYLGPSVLDSLLFQAVAHSTDADPLRAVVQHIKDAGLHRSGCVLYPLHSTGILGAGIFEWAFRARVALVAPHFHIALRSQTNSFPATLDFIKTALKSFGIRQTAPLDLLEHWRRSRPTSWLERNPLLLTKVASYPGTFYENQTFYLLRLRFAVTSLLMASTLQRSVPATSNDLWFGSSRRINNFQTLDIKHYFVFYPHPGNRKTLQGDCVPMNAQPATLAEFSELPIEVNPAHWRRRTRAMQHIAASLDRAEAFYASHGLFIKKDARSRVARKLVNSLKFFKRSFRPGDDGADEVVNLAIALETLLTDGYSAGVESRLVDRVKQLTGTIPEKRRILQSVTDLYRARSECVHQGTVPQAIDILAARQAFTYAFLSICQRLDRIPPQSPNPIQDIC